MGESVTIPNFKFNAFYCMFHSYHHMYESGLGLKRLVDYYFLLKAIFETAGIIEVKRRIVGIFKECNIMRFAFAVMWITQEVFRLDNNNLFCPPDVTEGRFILNEVM